MGARMLIDLSVPSGELTHALMHTLARLFTCELTRTRASNLLAYYYGKRLGYIYSLQAAAVTYYVRTSLRVKNNSLSPLTIVGKICMSCHIHSMLCKLL